MVNLKEMNFVEMPARDRDPVVAMRDKIVDRLREQAELLADPDHVRVTRRWRGKGEERHEYEQRQKVRPYWKPLPGGLYALAVYCGGTPLEFQPGKPCIAVKSRDELADTIQAAVIRLAGDGSLDDLISKAMAGKSKAKAKPARAPSRAS
jgi:hypothetical protein